MESLERPERSRRRPVFRIGEKCMILGKAQ